MHNMASGPRGVLCLVSFPDDSKTRSLITSGRVWERDSIMMAAAGDFKQFLYVFCGKRKVQPAYTYEQEGAGFYCEVCQRLT